MRVFFTALLSLSLMALATGCDKGGSSAAEGSSADKEKAAVAAAGPWLELIDQGKYDASWDQTAPVFQAAVTKASWPATVGAARQPFGKALKRSVSSSNHLTTIPGAPPGDYVIIQYTTDFEKKKGAVETITPALVDGTWKISGYYIK